MKTSVIPILIIAFLASCSSQRLSTDEHDDIYYSSSDRFNNQPSEFNQVDEVTGEDYISKDDYKRASRNNGSYYVLGEESKDINPNAQGAYESQMGAVSDSSSEGMTINNFYGTTTYYEDDGGADYYYDDSYASRIRRFNNVNVYANYGYYDPFFVDPYWNWGWGYYNPYPMNGWSFGWNSWNGWNASYNWGWGWNWGYPYYGSNWNYGWGWNSWNCGWGYGPGWGWNNGWGYNGRWGRGYRAGYWNGYNNGYYDGFYDGYYGFNDWYWNRDQQRRSTRVGRRDIVTDRGFGSESRVPVSAQATEAKGSKFNPSGLQASNQSGSVGIVDKVVKDDPKVKGNFASGSSASEQKLQKISNMYTPSKGKTFAPTNSSGNVNSKAVKASSSYQQNVKTAKYHSSGVRRTPVKENRYVGNTVPVQRSPKNVSTSGSKSPKQVGRTSPSAVNRGYSNQPSRSAGNSRSYGTPSKSSRNIAPSRSGNYSSPSRNQAPRNYSQPSNSSKPSKSVSSPSRSKSYSTPSSRSRSYSAPKSSPSRPSFGGGSSSRGSKPSIGSSSRSSGSFGGSRPSSSGGSGGSKPSLGRRR